MFCDGDPRLREFPLWFVGCNGEERQAARSYIDAAVASGRDRPVFGSASAGWLRRNAGLVVGLLLPVGGGLPGLAKLVAWLLLLWQQIGQ